MSADREIESSGAREIREQMAVANTQRRDREGVYRLRETPRDITSWSSRETVRLDPDVPLEEPMDDIVTRTRDAFEAFGAGVCDALHIPAVRIVAIAAAWLGAGIVIGSIIRAIFKL